MYWLASVSTWIASSSSRRPAGTVIFLVITCAEGSAMARLLIRVPMRFQPRRTESPTASRFMMLPSTTASLASGSIA